MDQTATMFWNELIARPNGPMAFRFIVQPTVAFLYAFRDGRRDAITGRPAYFWALFTKKTHRRALIRSGGHSIGKVFLIALILDLVYQAIALRGLRPLETIVVATVLAVLPYLVFRGPVNRLLRMFY